MKVRRVAKDKRFKSVPKNIYLALKGANDRREVETWQGCSDYIKLVRKFPKV